MKMIFIRILAYCASSYVESCDIYLPVNQIINNMTTKRIHVLIKSQNNLNKNFNIKSQLHFVSNNPNQNNKKNHFVQTHRNFDSFSKCFMKLSLAVWWSTMVTLRLWYECKTAILTSTTALSFHNEVGVRVSRFIFKATV